MKYSELVEVYEHLEKTSARLKKIDAIAELLKKSGRDLEQVALLMQGRVFPSWDQREIGIANLLMVKIIRTATGFPEKEIHECFRRTGDFGLVAQELTEKKKQRTLFHKVLTVEKVFENLQKLAGMTGKGSQERKFHLVSELIGHAKPLEAKFIARTTIGDLRIGVAEGVLRDAIAKAFLPMDDKEKAKESSSAVEWAWFLRPDYSEVAVIARDRGLKGLKGVKLGIGKPYHVLLCEKAPDLKTALETFENCGIEFKYDGARVVIERKGSEVWLYTRRLENVTKQFPKIVEYAKKHLSSRECIVEGEMLGINRKTGKPMPFQMLSQRIKRKYDIDKMEKELPVQVNLFDITYLHGRQLFDMPLAKRREELEKIVKPLEGRFQLAKSLVTKDLKKAQEFYEEALKANQEGVIVKNLDSKYQPGRRVGYWLKVKPTLENLDLVITGAQWGTGKRAGWLGSFILSCRDPHTGEFLECGMMGTGIKEKKGEGDVTFKELSGMLKPLITEKRDEIVEIRPKIIIEVSYEEIQKSPNYASGFALRFPRFIALREDKPLSEVDSVDRVEKIYGMQKGRRGS